MKMPCPYCKDGWDEAINQQCEKCDGSALAPITQGYVEWVLTHWEAVRWAGFEALKSYCVIIGDRPDYLDTIEEIDADTIVFTGEHSYCSCCGPEHYRVTMPTRFLYDESFREELVREQLEKIAREKAETHQKQAQVVRDREAKERALLAQLKEKYE